MPDFNDRSGNAGTGNGSVIRLEPLDHSYLKSTYHFSVADAHEAANTQSANYGGFRYNIHKDGKLVHANGLAYAKERTAGAQEYNSNAKAARR